MIRTAKCLISIEVFEDETIVVQLPEEKVVRKIKNPLVVVPLLMTLLAIPFGTEEVKDIKTWLDHVWIKRLKE